MENQKLIWVIGQVNGDFTTGHMETTVYSHQHNAWGSYWGILPEHFTIYETREDAEKVLKILNGTGQFIMSRWIDEKSNWGTHKE